MKPNEAFEAAFHFTTRPDVEGGFTVDQGGPTNHGVTQNAYSAWLKREERPDADVHAITIEDVRSVYYDDFWTEPRFDSLAELASPLLAIVMFDTGVNASPGRAVKLLQKIVCPEAIDGILGPNAIGLARKAIVIDNKDIPMLLLAERREYCLRLVEQNPKKYKADIKGWLNRLIHLEAYIKSLVPAKEVVA